jgi:ubiquinone/menaquinone biosynthesis C-methylase UbiE
MNKTEQKYIHGYSTKEQARLFKQAQFLEAYVYDDINFSNIENLLEVGCGVGAQTKILLNRFPHLKLTSVDLSESQLAVAREYLKDEIQSGQVELIQADATNLEVLGDKRFDAGFMCWFLEHVPQPVNVLLEVKKHIKRDGLLYLTEDIWSSFFVDPYSPSILNFTHEMVDYFWCIKGQPFVGFQLGNLLNEAKYNNINVEVRTFLFDGRDEQERNRFLQYFYELLESSKESLLEDGRITNDDFKKVHSEIMELKKNKNSVITEFWVRGTARV